MENVGDKNMKVEWLLKGKNINKKKRFKNIYEFGYVEMKFGWVYNEESGEYMCREKKMYGMDENREIIKNEGKNGIIYE